MVLALEQIRRLHGLSQRELAKAAGVSPATVLEIETGKRPTPQGRTLRKLAAALDVEVSDFFIEDSDLKAGAPQREGASGAFRRRVPFNARTAELYIQDVEREYPNLNDYQRLFAVIEEMRMRLTGDEEILTELERLKELIAERTGG